MFEIKSTETRKILLYFLINPREALYAGQLAGRLDLDSANTVNAPKKLEKEGVIAVKKKTGANIIS